MDYTRFTLELHNQIAQVRINRPDKANSLDRACWEELPQLFAELDERSDVRVVIISGEGKHFCAGIDLQMLASLNPAAVKDEARKREQLRRTILWLQEGIDAIEACSKPVIAAVHGGCIGAGLDLIAACDLRYASEDAYFVLKEVDMGMVADLGSLQRLPRIMPEGLVREMAYTGQPMSAAEAQTYGLVNRVYADAAELKEKVFETAGHISRKSPLAVRGIKQVMQHAREHSVAQGLEYVATWNAAHLLGHDLMKAVQAQMTKQEAEFED